MSKRAIEEAWKMYPKGPEQKFITAYGTFEFDHDAPNREGFIKGYEAAEKDLALTWEDMRKIIFIDLEMIDDPEAHPEWMEEQPFYEEILKRFKEAKQ